MATPLEQVRAACDIIRANPERRYTLSRLAGRVGLSPFHFQRTFTRLVGISPRAYAQACRLGQFKTALKKGSRVTPALYDAGYGSSSRLYERAGPALGMTPAAYRRGGEGVEIDFTVVASPLGRLLLAATVRGVCRVMIGDDDGSLERGLREEYPQATVRRNDRILSSQVRSLLSYVRGRSPHPELALDVRATAFQQRVWQELKAIPYGETRTYREVAAAIGRPSATRAVARACATNPVALLIPCHRVIRTDGSMGGYRWGIGRKEKLLAKEAAQTNERKKVTLHRTPDASSGRP
jgi:AraC family transcriptional regulator, regulatory protein of adaptative response / methylated-DNA-[protein]-cysteine methyltransferase